MLITQNLRKLGQIRELEKCQIKSLIITKKLKK